jgi:hypothetical protein
MPIERRLDEFKQSAPDNAVARRAADRPRAGTPCGLRVADGSSGSRPRLAPANRRAVGTGDLNRPGRPTASRIEGFAPHVSVASGRALPLGSPAWLRVGLGWSEVIEESRRQRGRGYIVDYLIAHPPCPVGPLAELGTGAANRHPIVSYRQQTQRSERGERQPEANGFSELARGRMGCATARCLVARRAVPGPCLSLASGRPTPPARAGGRYVLAPGTETLPTPPSWGTATIEQTRAIAVKGMASNIGSRNSARVAGEWSHSAAPEDMCSRRLVPCDEPGQRWGGDRPHGCGSTVVRRIGRRAGGTLRDGDPRLRPDAQPFTLVAAGAGGRKVLHWRRGCGGRRR